MAIADRHRTLSRLGRLAVSGHRGWIVEGVTVVVTVLTWRYVAQSSVIAGGSMQPALYSGDRVIVSRLIETRIGDLGRKLRRGDIVQCRRPGRHDDLMVKRLVGLPGDVVRIIEGSVFINDRLLPEPYKHEQSRWYDRAEAVFPDVTRNALIGTAAVDMFENHVRQGSLRIPDGAYFVLGDNRASSQDSRVFGLVPAEDVLGTVVFVLWSVDAHECDPNVHGDIGGCAFRAIRLGRLFLRPR